MRSVRTILFAGVAAAALGYAGAAVAQNPATHVMTVQLPGGGVAQIAYTGNVPPRVTLSDAPAPIGVLAPMPSLFGPGSPFAMMQRISAEMDREAAALFRRVELATEQARSGQLTEAALRAPGSTGYSYISTMSGNGVCAQSVEITSTGNGPPKVVSHSSGNCATSGGAAGTINLPNPSPSFGQPQPVWTSAPAPRPPATPAKRPDLLWTSAQGARPYAALVHEIPPAQ